MKKLVLLFTMSLFYSGLLISQISISTNGDAPHASAAFEINSTTKGLLLPRMTLEELSSISNPADGLLVYCTDCGPGSSGALTIHIADAWHTLSTCCQPPQTPSSGTHNTGTDQISWDWYPVINSTGYRWNTVDNFSGAFEMGTDTSYTETGLDCGTLYNRFVWAYNACGYSSATILTAYTIDCP